LLRCDDGWVAVSLARADDVAAVPAIVDADGPVDDPWAALTELARAEAERVLAADPALTRAEHAALSAAAEARARTMFAGDAG